ncbi:MAG: helix-turn-helix transcriptional regulator [Parvularculaceae bacterium]|nr:helix-turn-helix transcriptional regulator [Parvularculaceae bacterium]
MERLLRQTGFASAFAEASMHLARRAASKMHARGPSEILWLVFTASVSISTAARYVGDVPAPVSYVFAIGGAAGCGWLWLLARTLFRAEKPIVRWNLFAIAAIIAVEGYWNLVGASAPASEFERIAANASSSICIGALVLVFVEALSGYGAAMPKREKRFRVAFTLIFGAMVAVAILWAMNADKSGMAGRWADAALLGCAMVGVAGARFAVDFRKRNPLCAAKSRKTVPSAAAIDRRLAERILFALEENQCFATPDLKIADFAAALGEQDYKVTQCITGFLGYRNFNHMINARRIDHAKTALTDPDDTGRSILAIAFDCGFNSIGPFNRAFKQQVGMTPREFRACAGSIDNSSPADRCGARNL